MARFFVGQRVRIKWSALCPGLAGQEGRIVPLPTHMVRFVNPEGRPWAVAPEAWGAPYRTNPGDWFGPYEEQLEPILPSGHAACDEDFKRDLDKLLEGVSA